MTINDEFDVTDLTSKVSSLEEELRQADRLNGRLVRVLEDIKEAWHSGDLDRIAELMEELGREDKKEGKEESTDADS